MSGENIAPALPCPLWVALREMRRCTFTQVAWPTYPQCCGSVGGSLAANYLVITHNLLCTSYYKDREDYRKPLSRGTTFKEISIIHSNRLIFDWEWSNHLTWHLTHDRGYRQADTSVQSECRQRYYRLYSNVPPAWLVIPHHQPQQASDLGRPHGVINTLKILIMQINRDLVKKSFVFSWK